MKWRKHLLEIDCLLNPVISHKKSIDFWCELLLAMKSQKSKLILWHKYKYAIKVENTKIRFFIALNLYTMTSYQSLAAYFVFLIETDQCLDSNCNVNLSVHTASCSSLIMKSGWLEEKQIKNLYKKWCPMPKTGTYWNREMALKVKTAQTCDV